MQLIKKIVLLFTFLISASSLSAQWAVYENVPSIHELEIANSIPSQTIAGYVYTRQGWLKVPIMVKASRHFVLVVGYNNVDFGDAYATYSSVNPWNSCSKLAQEVTEYSDDRDICRIFSYRVNIPNIGVVYF